MAQGVNLHSDLTDLPSARTRFTPGTIGCLARVYPRNYRGVLRVLGPRASGGLPKRCPQPLPGRTIRGQGG